MKNLKVKYTWLHISIFYNSLVWHNLMESALLPLINALTEDEIISGFFICLSSDRGDHIKLSVEYKNNADIADRIEKYIGTYLTQHPSQEVRDNYPGANLFMNLPNNSYFYNLYEDSAIKKNKNTRVLYYKFLISKYILNDLFVEMVSPEDILTALVYLQLCFIRAVYPSQAAAKEGSIKLIRYLDSSLHKNDANNSKGLLEESIIAVFNDCPAILTQIAGEVWDESTLSTAADTLCFSGSGYYPVQTRTLNKDFSMISRLIYEALGFNALNHQKVSRRLLEIVFSE